MDLDKNFLDFKKSRPLVYIDVFWIFYVRDLLHKQFDTETKAHFSAESKEGKYQTYLFYCIKLDFISSVDFLVANCIAHN